MIAYEANWCVNHGPQSNQFVGKAVEEEEEIEMEVCLSSVYNSSSVV